MEDILDVNAISKELSKISIGSLALDKLLSGVFALVVCLLCIWLLMKLTDKALANSKRLDGALRGFIGLIIALPATTIIIAYWKKYVTKEPPRTNTTTPNT